jgi:CspA family cold shock protein
MAEGVVKWFNSEQGHGMLTALGYAEGDIKVGRRDIFVHYSEIQVNGYKTLDEGEHVSFDIERLPDGRFRARHVTQLGGPPPSWLTDRAGAPPRLRRTRFLLVMLVVVVLIGIIAAFWLG